MNYYRITKYNPKFRDRAGNYSEDEWTSISDVGKLYNNVLFTMKSYLGIEDQYIQAVDIILKENNITEICIDSLEKYDDFEMIKNLTPEEVMFYNKIKNGMSIRFNDIKTIIKLALRELIWCKLYSNTNSFEIEFGYDYYLYIRCKNIDQSIIQTLSSKGLYVELISKVQ